VKIAVFSAKAYDRTFLSAANAAQGGRHTLTFLEPRLDAQSASLAAGAGCVCAFVDDQLDADTLSVLHAGGTRLVALRSAGFNNVDLARARALGLMVARVPAYSPEAVAEHTVALMLSLNRKIYRARDRVREGNFALEGLIGFNMHGRTAGIIGTGLIGMATARILSGFGCRLLGSDPMRNPAFEALGGSYVEVPDLLRQSDIVTLHCPLTSANHHLIDRAAIDGMKRGVMLINTSRGALIDTRAAIDGLKSGAIGTLGLDVYEEEGGMFFNDLSNSMIQDDVFARLLTFPNVLVTGHQAFFTVDAMTTIAETTIGNVSAFEDTGSPEYEVCAD
jgi:D-lactate dehydrogenase